MKKRLLVLALCLVLATSLLPITAAATNYKLNSANITSYGWLVGNLPGMGNVYQLNITDWELVCDGVTIKKDTPNFYTNSLITLDKNINNPLKTQPQAGVPYYAYIEIYNISEAAGHSYSKNQFEADLEITLDEGFTAKFDSAEILYTLDKADYGIGIWFRLIKEEVHEHDWDFDMTENSVTATCGNSGCPIGQASLTLDAHSVTLPDSPFNARGILKGITEEQIKEDFGYTIGPIRYKFKAPGDSAFTDITPADGAREGTYQASVTLTPLYAQASYALNDDGTANQGPIFGNDGSVTLYTQYTAVNPEVTAQTGDNRPIEIMMASALVFSALAAAAFVLDSKRKYSR